MRLEQGGGLASFDRRRHDARMRLPWNKSTDLQLDLLDTAAIADVVSPPPTAASTSFGQPLMLAVTSLYVDSDNPRTEVPEAELDELTNDIRERGVLQPIRVGRARGREHRKILLRSYKLQVCFLKHLLYICQIKNKICVYGLPHSVARPTLCPPAFNSQVART